MSEDTTPSEPSTASKIIGLGVLIIIVTIAINFYLKGVLKRQAEELLADYDVTVETVIVPFSANFSSGFEGDVIGFFNDDGEHFKLEFNVSGNPFLNEMYYVEIPGSEVQKLIRPLSVLEDLSDLL